MPLYPLKFRPVFKRYLWGGRRLETVLGKPLGSSDDYAESWELADHDQGQSVVANGPLEGKTLHELVAKQGSDLFGRHADSQGRLSLAVNNFSGQFLDEPDERDKKSPPPGGQPRFPLIFKYLDAQQDLSVQVHPNDAAAAKLSPPDLGKTEAWVVLDARPGSRVYAGLKYGITRETFEREVRAGRAELCLNWFEARPGDCIFIPAGTVHALGAGLLIAEIQQASDTTYRLFDWNRTGPDGQPRKLHIEEGLAAVDYSIGAVRPTSPRPTPQPHIERLVACDKFVLDRWRLESGATLGGDGRFHIVTVLEGEVLLSEAGDEAGQQRIASSTTADQVTLLSLIRGQTVLLPANLGPAAIAPREKAVVLDIYLP